jgi:hypothetical protein
MSTLRRCSSPASLCCLIFSSPLRLVCSWFVFDRIDKVGPALVAACADARVRDNYQLPAFGGAELAAIRMYATVLKPLADFTTRSEGDLRAEANAEALPFLATLVQKCVLLFLFVFPSVFVWCYVPSVSS